jgi:hypothetical protein
MPHKQSARADAFGCYMTGAPQGARVILALPSIASDTPIAPDATIGHFFPSDRQTRHYTRTQRLCMCGGFVQVLSAPEIPICYSTNQNLQPGNNCRSELTGRLTCSFGQCGTLLCPPPRTPSPRPSVLPVPRLPAFGAGCTELSHKPLTQAESAAPERTSHSLQAKQRSQ